MTQIPGGIYMLKISNRNTRTRCEICSELTIKTLERRQWISIVNFKHLIVGGDTSVSQNSQFKEQFESQNLGDSPDETLHHLKLKKSV